MQPLNVALVRAAGSDENRLKNLLSLYVHDFSEFLGLKPSEEGWFSYPSLPLFLSNSGRAAYLVRSEGNLVGFALLSQGSVISGDPTVFDLAEFFVVRGVRRRGVGQAAAHQLFSLHPGKWEIRVAEFNTAAQDFWRNVIERFVGGHFAIDPWARDDGTRWNVCRFTSAARPMPECIAPDTSLRSSPSSTER